MGQAGGDRDLLEESVRAEHGGQVGAKHFDRDVPVVPLVRCQEDDGHAAHAELSLDTVAASQSHLQLMQQVRHTQVLGRSVTQSCFLRGGLAKSMQFRHLQFLAPFRSSPISLHRQAALSWAHVSHPPLHSNS